MLMEVGWTPLEVFEEKMDRPNGRNGCFGEIHLAELERMNWRFYGPPKRFVDSF